MIHCWLLIPITFVDPKEIRFKQVSLSILVCMNTNAVYNNCIRTHKNSLTSPLFLKCLYQFVPSQESERSCICVLGVSILHLSVIFLLDWGTVLTVWYFWGFLFHFSFGSRNCSDKCCILCFSPFFYCIEEQFWQCGILRFSFYYQIYHNIKQLEVPKRCKLIKNVYLY